MRLPEEVVVVLVVSGKVGGEVAQLVELLGRLAHLGPVQLGDDASDELGIELNFRHLDIASLNTYNEDSSDISNHPVYLEHIYAYLDG